MPFHPPISIYRDSKSFDLYKSKFGQLSSYLRAPVMPSSFSKLALALGDDEIAHLPSDVTLFKTL